MINLWSFWTHACTHTHTYTNTHIREISLKTSSLELGDSILFSFPIWSASSCHEAQDINDVNTRELICTQSSTFIQWHQALQLDSALQHSEFMSQNLGKTSHKKKQSLLNSNCSFWQTKKLCHFRYFGTHLSAKWNKSLVSFIACSAPWSPNHQVYSGKR